MRGRWTAVGFTLLSTLVASCGAQSPDDERTGEIGQPVVPGLVAAYGFNEGSGSTAGDASGLGNTGALSAVTWSAAGKFGAAASFNGTSSRVAVPDASSLDLASAMTLEAWVKPAAGGGSWKTVVLKEQPGELVYALYSGTSGAGPMGIAFASGTEQKAGTATALASGVWTHLAVTYDGSAVRLYVNGSVAATKATSGSMPNSTGSLQIGGNTVWNEYFSGLIDEVRVYDRALSAAEVQTDMNTPVGGSPPPDPTPPTVQLTSPTAGATVSGVTTVSASATDNVAVAGVQFKLDGANLGAEDTSAPYSINWDTASAAAGSHSLTAVARDPSGNTTTSAAVNVTVATGGGGSFVNETLIVNLDEPTTLTFAPDGRTLITGRKGTVWVAMPGAAQVNATPFLQLSSVDASAERGLLGLALDPAFSTNGFYYIYYTHTSLKNRISRFTASGNVTPAASELIIWQEGIQSEIYHQGGCLQFGPDGYLYASVGDHLDGASAQSLASYNGKILRMKTDGTAPADNPFNDGAGPNFDLIWARGLRNPFRISFDAPTGRLYIADVGQNDWEEVNVGAAGANYGWPTCEGTCGTAGFTNPLYTYNHAGHDASITGGFVYRGTQFPAQYQGNYFFGDYAQNWIRRLVLNANGTLSSVQNFEPPDGSLDGPYGDVVDLKQGPDGALYYVDIGPFEQANTGKVRRIRFASSNTPPVAQAAGSPQSGVAPLSVNFSSSGSVDPEGQPITYSWNFGDATSSTAANPTHVYASSGVYTARLTVSDGVLSSISSPINISVGTPPVPTITSPTDGSHFVAGQVINLSGSATDAEDGALPGSKLSWTVIFLHEGHQHPAAGPTTGSTTTFTIPSSGHDFGGNTRYQIVLTATDSTGLSATKSVIVWPTKVNLQLTTSPVALPLLLDGISRTTPFVLDTLVGFQHTIEAPAAQTLAGTPYQFVAWSDGGPRVRPLTVPSSNVALSAQYQVSATDPDLVAAWSFNEGSGASAADVSGGGHVASLSGATWTGAGKFGGALSFNGTSSWLTVADDAALDLSSGMTLEAWVNMSASGDWRTVILKEQPGELVYALYANATGDLPAGIVFTGGQEKKRFGTSTLATNTWIHLATTYDGAMLRFYVNGVLVGSSAVSGPMPASSGVLRIGGNAVWNEFFAGAIDEVRIYKKALTVGQIQSDMATPL